MLPVTYIKYKCLCTSLSVHLIPVLVETTFKMGEKDGNKKYSAFPLKMIRCLVVRDSGVGLEWISHQDINRFQTVRSGMWSSELNHYTFRGHGNQFEVFSQTKTPGHLFLRRIMMTLWWWSFSICLRAKWLWK